MSLDPLQSGRSATNHAPPPLTKVYGLPPLLPFPAFLPTLSVIHSFCHQVLSPPLSVMIDIRIHSATSSPCRDCPFHTLCHLWHIYMSVLSFPLQNLYPDAPIAVFQVLQAARGRTLCVGERCKQIQQGRMVALHTPVPSSCL